MSDIYRDPEAAEMNQDKLTRKFFEALGKAQETAVDSNNEKDPNDAQTFAKRVYLEKIKFFLEWYSIEPEKINLESIESSLLASNIEELSEQSTITDFALDIIYLKMAKKEYSQVLAIASGVNTKLGSGNDLALRIYRAAIIFDLPEEYKDVFRSSALAVSNIESERFIKFEKGWKKFLGDPDLLRLDRLDKMSSLIIGAYKYCPREVPDSLVEDIKKIDPQFKVPPVSKADLYENKSEQRERIRLIQRMSAEELESEYEKYKHMSDKVDAIFMGLILQRLEDLTSGSSAPLLVIEHRIKNLDSMSGGKGRRNERAAKIVADLEKIIDDTESDPALKESAIRLYKSIVGVIRRTRISVKFRDELIKTQKDVRTKMTSQLPDKTKNTIGTLPKRRETRAPVEIKFDPEKMFRLAEDTLAYVGRVVTNRDKNWQSEAENSVLRAKAYVDMLREFLAKERLGGKTIDPNFEINVVILEKQIYHYRTLIYRNQGIRKHKTTTKERAPTKEDPHTPDLYEINQLINRRKTVEARHLIVEILREGTKNRDILKIAFDFAMKDMEPMAAENILFILRPYISDQSFKEKLSRIQKLEEVVARSGGARFGGGTVWGDFGTREPIDGTAYNVTEWGDKENKNPRKKSEE